MDAALIESGNLWQDTLPEIPRRPPLPGDRDADVAIIGAGLTGLWTAYYLLDRDPALRVVLLEKEFAGFGASGRNGGWCSALFPTSTAALERRHGREAALAMRRAMIATVDEVGRAAAAEQIDCDFAKGGTVAWARSAVQLRAARADVDEARSYGVDHLELWGADRVAAIPGALGAAFDPACARLHPAKLVRGVAEAVERRGAVIHENTTVLDWAQGCVVTDRGTVTAGRVVLATEAWTATFRKTHRALMPLYSLMVATEPLPESFWAATGIEHGQTFTDFRHLLIYGQRTADNRIAFGGRGARYHWGSTVRPGYDLAPRVFEHLHVTLRELFPALGDARITHRWGGPIGVPRDWHASVRFDPSTGIASAGGYVGDGLSTTNLAGRTLADLLIGSTSDLTALPWVQHRCPDWEPEPLRFAGANAALVAAGLADTEERVTRRRSLIARVIAPLTGH